MRGIVDSPLQGGGRWFESCIAHIKELILQVKHRTRKRAGIRFLALLLQPHCNPASPRAALWRLGRVCCEVYEKDGAMARLAVEARTEGYPWSGPRAFRDVKVCRRWGRSSIGLSHKTWLT